MGAFLYRCPLTNQHVQGWAEDGEAGTLQTVHCLACQRSHLIDPKNGKVIGPNLPER